MKRRTINATAEHGISLVGVSKGSVILVVDSGKYSIRVAMPDWMLAELAKDAHKVIAYREAELQRIRQALLNQQV